MCLSSNGEYGFNEEQLKKLICLFDDDKTDVKQFHLFCCKLKVAACSVNVDWAAHAVPTHAAHTVLGSRHSTLRGRVKQSKGNLSIPAGTTTGQVAACQIEGAGRIALFRCRQKQFERLRVITRNSLPGIVRVSQAVHAERIPQSGRFFEVLGGSR